MWRWALMPWVLIAAVPLWLAVILPAWVLGMLKYKGKLRHDVFYFEAQHLDRDWTWALFWDTLGSVAMPFAVISKGCVDHPDVANHMLRHNDQWIVFGPIFGPLYFVFCLAFGRLDNPFEWDAHEHGADLRTTKNYWAKR